MQTLLLSTLVALIISILDIIPMIIQKIPRYSIISAFLFFFFITIVIFHCNITVIPWWLQGSVISIAMMSPILVHVQTINKDAILVIAINTIILGTLISIAKYYLL